MPRQVFAEPSRPRTTPLAASEPKLNWFLESTRLEAIAGRRVVNDLYSRFPDRDGHMYAELHGPDENRLLGALDELLVHDLLARRYEVAYEEGAATRPDFRLYEPRGRTYIGAVEVATLFLRDDWATEERRHAKLQDDLNTRLPLTTHSVEFEVLRWDTTPSVRHIARWLESTIDDLRVDPNAVPLDELGDPEKVYSTNKGIEIVFRFTAHPETYVVQAGDRIVSAGPSIGGAVDSAARLRERLDDKAAKYDLHGKPYAIVAVIRDGMCDLDDVHEALTGTSAIAVKTGQTVRKGDGFFGTGRDRAEGKHQRVSAVYSIHNWYPGGPYQPLIIRFDNPFARHTFPKDALPINGHWGEVERSTTSVKADWLVPPTA